MSFIIPTDEQIKNSISSINLNNLEYAEPLYDVKYGTLRKITVETGEDLVYKPPGYYLRQIDEEGYLQNSYRNGDEGDPIEILSMDWQKLNDDFFTQIGADALLELSEQVPREKSYIFGSFGNPKERDDNFINSIWQDCSRQLGLGEEHKFSKICKIVASAPRTQDWDPDVKIKITKQTADNCKQTSNDLTKISNDLKINQPLFNKQTVQKKDLEKIAAHQIKEIAINLQKKVSHDFVASVKKRILKSEYIDYILQYKEDLGEDDLGEVVPRDFCMACGGILCGPLGCDHIIPILQAFTSLAIGGFTYSKIQWEFTPLHSTCNTQKGNKPLHTWWKDVGSYIPPYCISANQIKSKELCRSKLAVHLKGLVLNSVKQQTSNIILLVKFRILEMLNYIERNALVAGMTGEELMANINTRLNLQQTLFNPAAKTLREMRQSRSPGRSSRFGTTSMRSQAEKLKINITFLRKGKRYYKSNVQLSKEIKNKKKQLTIAQNKKKQLTIAQNKKKQLVELKKLQTKSKGKKIKITFLRKGKRYYKTIKMLKRDLERKNLLKISLKR